jgi:hypothetical protein
MIEKLWNNSGYDKLTGELLAGRAERSLRLQEHLVGSLPALAMTLIRLEELSQSHVPLYGKLLRTLLAAQESDGGWKEPMTTALCIRALLGGRGQGPAIDRGLAYLANLQKPEGIWPDAPVRRMPADAFASAYILLQLGADSRFRNAVRFAEAVSWFESNARSLDGETARLWAHASVRCRDHRAADPQNVLNWS